MTQARSILIIDGLSGSDTAIQRCLPPGCASVTVATGCDGLHRLDSGERFDAVLIGEPVTDMGVPALLAALSGAMPALVLTAPGRQSGAGLLRAGAQDHLPRAGLSRRCLGHALERAIERHALAAVERSRYRAQAAAEDRCRSLVNLLDEGVCLIEMINDPAGRPVDYRFLAVNASFERHCGLHDATGRCISELAPSLDPSWIQRYGEVAASGRAARLMHQAKGLNGHWYEVFASRLGGPTSQQVVVSFKDINERRRVEDAMRESEQLFRSTFEHAALGIAHVGLDGHWLMVNPALSRITGFSASELKARRFTELTHPDDLDGNLALVRQLLAGEMTSFAVDKRYIRKGGDVVWVNLTVALQRDDQGNPSHMIATVENITARQQALQELERQQRFIERLTHVMPNTLHVVDIVQRRVLWANRALGPGLGYTAAELARFGSHFLQHVLHPDDRAPMRAHVAAIVAAADNQVLELEYRLRHKDGSWRWVRNCDTPFRRDEMGRVIELVGTTTDVTEQRRASSALQAALAAAENANDAKSDFLSSMSHELRSPLNAILGFAQLIESGTPAPGPAQQDSVQQILKAGWYLLDLINGILDLSHVESGQLALTLESVALQSLLDDCRTLIEPLAMRRGVTIDFAPLQAESCMVADATRLKQVCINLLSNAVKYNRPGGQVRVTCSAGVGQRPRLGFHDTGNGLSAEQLARLFQPFERLGQESSHTEGSGIGLVVSKRLVEMMGGSIGVDSSIGQGSTFWIELDAAVAPPVAAAAPLLVGRPAAADAPCLHTVLCVEDNPANLQLVQRIVARRPQLRLLSACDAEEGIAMARTARPDAILMDVHLPGMNGQEALQILAADPATAHIPVLALSANAMARDIERGLAAGFFRYLTKPIEIDSFTSALDSALLVSATTRPSAAQEVAT